MRKILILFSISFLLLSMSCKAPKVIRADGKNYRIIEWEGGTFYYVTYHWKGGKFDDAILIIESWNRWIKDNDFPAEAIGRFPTGKEWQLGILSSSPLELKEFKGLKVESMSIPMSSYGSQKAKGYPENIFVLWESFRKELIRDGYEVQSPVFEIYKEAFDPAIDVRERIGEIRYQVQEHN